MCCMQLYNEFHCYPFAIAFIVIDADGQALKKSLPAVKKSTLTLVDGLLINPEKKQAVVV